MTNRERLSVYKRARQLMADLADFSEADWAALLDGPPFRGRPSTRDRLAAAIRKAARVGRADLHKRQVEAVEATASN